MRLILRLLTAAIFILAPLSSHAAHTQAKLLLAADTVRPGETVLAGVQLRMDSNWHTYWRNSGASGQATKIEWQLPAGITAGATQWPIPDKLPEQELTTYVYTNEVVLLVPLKVASDVGPGRLKLQAKVSWLECDLQCVPGKADLEGFLTVDSETKPSADAELLATWQKKLPRDGSSLAARARWEKPAMGDTRPLILEWNPAKPASDADFFPDGYEKFELQGETERLPAETGKIALRKQVKKFEGDWPSEISGVVVQGSGNERVGYEVRFQIGGSAASVSGNQTLPSPTVAGHHSLWQIILFGFLGGLILNVMPCVLPVIALKVLGFVGQANDEPGRVRKLGLIYVLGVIVSFLILAWVVIALRSVGATVGWGLQFSNPYFVIVMTILVTLISLNLFGVFEISAGGRTMAAASTLSSKHGAMGAFFNGLLTTVLATSCSAPILASAIGFAFTKSTGSIFIVMLSIALGLASPYLLLSWYPALLKFLPKPGAWMEKFKMAMGFPMLAAAIWLCSLVQIYYGERAWWMAMFLVFLAVAMWVYGEFVQRGRKHRLIAGGVAAVLLAVGYAYALEYGMRWREQVKAVAREETPSEVPRGLKWQKWSVESVADARAKGQVVVVDFTAKWCLTCNTVVKPAFESESVQQKIAEIGAIPFVADFTLFPPDIADELKRFDRSGVPLVLVYPKNASEPPKVFDIVSPGTLVAALNEAAQ